jgi:uroporphyrinogen III methyltransferase/synthase
VSGRVHLVGAGPGDPGLMTARALELIAAADVILYDRLIPSSALDGARADAELLFVGKEGGGPSVAQEQTQELMVERAQAGNMVVRLKGGDPFVFGRGGEEALALRAAGIAFEIVPGVTAGVAASAYAGIPVTHRGLASAVALVTGHAREDAGGSGDEDESAIDWVALAAFPGTLVLYMGVRRLEQIAASLIAAGRPGSQAAAVVEAGTLPGQRTVTGTLASIAETARREGIRAPSITIVGPVASLATQLAWLAPRPLGGLTVAVTRARAQASTLARRLEALGASVVQAPVIRVQQLSASSPHPSSMTMRPGTGEGDPARPEPLDPAPYDLICLTSANAVEGLFERLDDGTHPRGDARALAGTTVAAIGGATARALAERGILADVLPERFVAESLVEALADRPVTRALIARAREARDVLPEALRARGAHVDVLALYETVAEPLSPRALSAVREADYVTFTSSSSVHHFLRAAGGKDGLSATARIVSIGPVTSATLREHGLEPRVEAERHDVDGMIDALLADAAQRSP